ncbi:MAG: hypothetical protein H6983_17685 [Ectothiorhodospiraceae bacterium]|nr:hypothetical protein [Chromatiales bacterium]MCP5156008.1 hypothetical protein [Ectothiorhodospiraceae bacterium]
MSKQRESGLVVRIHHREHPSLATIWDEFNRLPLPRVEHLRDVYRQAPPEVWPEIERLGQTCTARPPIPFPFRRGLSFRVSDLWLVHLGRLSIDTSKVKRMPLYWKVKEVFGDDARMSGFFYYPPGGFKEWHTDFEDPQSDPEKHWRVYMVKAEDDRKSWFQYVDPDTGKIKKVFDRDAHLNLFSLKEEPPLWHAVWSDTQRWCLGIKLGEQAIQSLLEIEGVERLAS